jgi:hypothetical protein
MCAPRGTKSLNAVLAAERERIASMVENLSFPLSSMHFSRHKVRRIATAIAEHIRGKQ